MSNHYKCFFYSKTAKINTYTNEKHKSLLLVFLFRKTTNRKTTKINQCTNKKYELQCAQSTKEKTKIS